MKFPGAILHFINGIYVSFILFWEWSSIPWYWLKFQSLNSACVKIYFSLSNWTESHYRGPTSAEQILWSWITQCTLERLALNWLQMSVENILSLGVCIWKSANKLPVTSYTIKINATQQNQFQTSMNETRSTRGKTHMLSNLLWIKKNLIMCFNPHKQLFL
jgi:hypothetical protein